MRTALGLVVVVAIVTACGDGGGEGGGDGGDSDSGGDDGAGVGVDAGPTADATGPAAPVVRQEAVTGEHRAVPGAMFGGWGPHLGHLVRAPRAAAAGGGVATYWVDDLCNPATPGDCDVNVNRRVGVFRRDDGAWTRLATMPLPGVQQNTATIAAGDRLFVFGLASGAQRVIECSYAITTGASGCTTIPIPTGAFANYIGAAVSPTGARLVWWTNVVDGGGGSFSYLIDYGGGWNGPRTGAVGGYNDCGYAHAGFGPDGASVELFCQVVAGNAPNWSFATLVGTTPANLANAVAWQSGLAPPPGDAIASTNDLLVERQGGDAHLLARSAAGAAVYYHKPAGGAYGAPALVLPATFRARWVVGDGVLALVHDAGPGALVVRRAPPGALDAPGALDPASWPALPVALPEGFGMIYGIYPVAPAYTLVPGAGVELVVVGQGDEHAARYVSVE